MRNENRQRPHSAEEPDQDLRKAFEEQAKELKQDAQAWRPSWKALGLEFAHKEFARSQGKKSAVPKWMAKP